MKTSVFFAAALAAVPGFSDVDRTVTFDRPNRGPEWVMPVGAGDFGAMVSVVSNAVELHLSKTDYLAEANPDNRMKGLQLLSPGHVSLVFGNLKTNDLTSFRQTLDPVAGTVTVTFATPSGEITSVIYGERSSGALAVDVSDSRPDRAPARAVYTLWRTGKGVIPEYRVFTDIQGDPSSSAYSLLVSCGTAARAAAAKTSAAARRDTRARWWRSFWEKGWLLMEGDPKAEYLTRLWWINMYAYAGVGYGPVPPKFNGGTGLVIGDCRHWGKDLWYQNTRELMWPMCVAGHPEFAKGILDFYDECFENVFANTPKRYPEFAGSEAVVLPETMPFLDNGRYTPPKTAAPDVRRPYREPTDAERRASRARRLKRGASHVSHVYSSGAELVQQMIEYVRFTGDRSYLPKIARWLRGAAELYLMLLERGEDGLWHVHASHVNESWWRVDDGIVDLAAARFVLFQTVAHGKSFGYPGNLVAAAKTRLDALAPYPTAERIEWGRRKFIDVKRVTAGTRIFTPCVLKDGMSKNNFENNELYLVYPFAMCESGELRARMLRTYPESYDSDCGNYGWSAVSVGAVRLGLPKAAEYVYNHAAATAQWPYGGGKSPSLPLYRGAKVEEAPYLDGTGVTLTGIQELLLQSHPAEPSADLFRGGKIRRLPGVPAGWRVRFRLHARGGKVVEYP